MARQLKHSKIKNTGILFELLTRQITADILNDKPTKINTIPKVKPYSMELIFSEIIEKFVEPEKPYNKEQPYNNMPDDKALNTKYFSPASDDFN